MKRVLSSVITVVISFCLVAGFTPASIAKAENIKVGAILAVTGGASFLGGPEARTLEMMVEEINAKGGILSLIHISEPTRPTRASRMPSSA